MKITSEMKQNAENMARELFMLIYLDILVNDINDKQLLNNLLILIKFFAYYLHLELSSNYSNDEKL